MVTLEIILTTVYSRLVFDLNWPQVASSGLIWPDLEKTIWKSQSNLKKKMSNRRNSTQGKLKIKNTSKKFFWNFLKNSEKFWKIRKFMKFRNVFDESLEDKIELQGLAASWVDSSSRRIFPISFLIFNIVYWSFCLYHKYRTGWDYP